MKKLMYLTVLFLVLIFIAGCDDQSSIVEPPQNQQNGDDVLAKMTVLNQIDEVVPISGTRFIPCINGGAGEDVVTSGTAKIKFTEFLDGNGGYHSRSSFQMLEYEAVGQLTGDIYQGVGGKERQNVNVGSTGFPVSVNFTANYNYHGPNNNYRETARVKIVYNANGDLKLDFFNVSIDCN